MGKAKKQTPKPKNKKNINKNLKRIEENKRVLKMILENQK
jgi:ribosomal protein S30